MLTENGAARAPLMMNIQDVGGVRKTVERGIAAIRELEMAGVRAAFLNAIQAAMDRGRELTAGDE